MTTQNGSASKGIKVIYGETYWITSNVVGRFAAKVLREDPDSSSCYEVEVVEYIIPGGDAWNPGEIMTVYKHRIKELAILPNKKHAHKLIKLEED